MSEAIATSPSKRCATCKRDVSLDGYYGDRSRRDGLEACCKTCRRASRAGRRVPDSRPCLHCGAIITRRGHKGVVPKYCYDDPDCYRRCIVENCDGHGRTQGYCATHYSRFRKHGDPLAGPRCTRYEGAACTVEGCDEAATTRGCCDHHYRRLVRYGDPTFVPPIVRWDGCKVDGCQTTEQIRLGYCVKHYFRYQKYGDPVAAGLLSQYRSDDPDRPSCSVSGCGLPYASNGMCRKHLYRTQRYGDPSGAAEFHLKHAACLVCGTPPPHLTYRNFCSASCYAAHRALNGDVPLTGECVVCKGEIQFSTVDRSGVRRYRRRQWCVSCQRRQRGTRYALSAAQLAERDGAVCAICQDPVDMDLRRADFDGMWMPSVDHRIPLAKGGTHGAFNLQLSHLLCNIRKRDRVPT